MCDDDYEKTLKIAGKKHDLTGFRVYDHREERIPDVGMLEMIDAETGAQLLVDTRSPKVRMAYERNYARRVQFFREVFSKCGAGTVQTRVDESYVTRLLGYFKARA